MASYADMPYWLNAQLFEPHTITPDNNGIETYTVVRLDTPEIPLPENIYLSTEKDPARASMDMYWALHGKPRNFATWIVPEEVFPRALKQRIAEKKQQDPRFFNRPIHAWQYNSSVRLWADGQDRRQQECRDILAAEQYSGNDVIFIMEWLRESIRVLKNFTAPLERKNPPDLSRHFNIHTDSRSIGLEKIALHLDGAGPPPEHKINRAISPYPVIQPRFPSVNDDLDYSCDPNSPGTNPVKILFYRFLWSQNDIGAFCADQEDIDEVRTEYHACRPGDTLIRFKNPHPVLYAAAPWSISMVSSYFHPHHPAVHTSPPKTAAGKDLQRILWDNSLYIRDNLSVEEYREWAEEKAKPMPLFPGHKGFAP